MNVRGLVVWFTCVLAAITARADKPFPAHRVIGNVYYVGSDELATYLITTPDGHLLINSGFDETVPLIQASVESLGFKITDDFDSTFAKLKKLPCDVFLGAHGNYYGMHAKYDRVGKGGDNPFVDPAGYRAYVADREQVFRTKLAEQRNK